MRGGPRAYRLPDATARIPPDPRVKFDWLLCIWRYGEKDESSHGRNKTTVENSGAASQS